MDDDERDPEPLSAWLERLMNFYRRYDIDFWISDGGRMRWGKIGGGEVESSLQGMVEEYAELEIIIGYLDPFVRALERSRRPLSLYGFTMPDGSRGTYVPREPLKRAQIEQRIREIAPGATHIRGCYVSQSAVPLRVVDPTTDQGGAKR